jgi:hypothetical protein
MGGQGCTPGYWKQCQHFSDWVCPYCPQAPGIFCQPGGGTAHLGCGTCTTGTLFCDVFRCPSGGASTAYAGKTLLQVLQQGGGGYNALGRHVVAALLNSAKLGCMFSSQFCTPADVIAKFNMVVNASPTAQQIEQLKNLFAALNEQGCPLNGHSDLNGDGLVNQTDLNILLAKWGTADPVADIDNDGIVGPRDLVILLSWWGH